MPCINASLVTAIASMMTYATANAIPQNQKLPRDTSKGKVMLEVYSRRSYCYKTIVRKILPRLRDAVTRKLPENNWFLMHDNAPAHRAIIVKNFLARHNITALDHQPYSPDLSPPDNFLSEKSSER